MSKIEDTTNARKTGSTVPLGMSLLCLLSAAGLSDQSESSTHRVECMRRPPTYNVRCTRCGSLLMSGVYASQLAYTYPGLGSRELLGQYIAVKYYSISIYCIFLCYCRN